MDPHAKGVLVFDGRPIIATQFPDAVRKAIADAKPGDLRFYTSPENHFYVLAIQDVTPARPRPYEQVQEEIAKKVLDVKFQKAVVAYAEKLRSLSDVKVYLKAS
jgi:parvulin-like peptidyl-prolyl isomerase